MKTKLPALILAAIGITEAAEATAPSFDLKANVQAQGIHAWRDNAGDKLMQSSFFRVNFGADYKADDMRGSVNLRVFPVGYGNTLVESVGSADSSGAISSKSKSVERLFLEQAWAEYLWGSTTLKLGRWSTAQSRSSSMGNFLDQDVGIVFLTRVTYHDAAELSQKFGPVSTGFMLGFNNVGDVGDQTMNTGYIRATAAFKKEGFPVEADIGYRSNLWDKIQDADAPLRNRYSLRTAITVVPGMILFGDIAMVDAVDSKGSLIEKQQIPLVAGGQVTFPTNTTVTIEGEYVKDRTVSKAGAIKYADEDPDPGYDERPVDLALSVAQKVGTRTKFQFLLSSDPKANDIFELQSALRVTTTLQ